jgi:uncharacterized membrane protein YqiK
MKKLYIKLIAIVVIIVIIGFFFFFVGLMKNEPNNFNPDKEWKFLLENNKSTEN